MMMLKVFAAGPHAMGIPLPAYETSGSAGLDLSIAGFGGKGDDVDHYVLPAGMRVLVKTGYAMQIPDGFEGQIRPRSGIALRRGIQVHPGTIDSDFRGEVGVIVFNLGRESVRLDRGMRIAQMVVAPVARCNVVEVTAADLSTTERGSGGFGHTGGS